MSLIRSVARGVGFPTAAKIGAWHAASRLASTAAKPEPLFQKFRVFRYDPESAEQPYMQEFQLNLGETGPMILDALIKMKSEIDPSLTFRRSCREGVCGSCAMNINGTNGLACTQYISRHMRGEDDAIEIQPLPSMYVIRDLVPDLSDFYKQYSAVKPWLQRKTPKTPGQAEYLQSKEDRKKLDGLYECVLCACCTTSCPSYWWNPETFSGPQALLQAYRWISDSRDEHTSERLARTNETMKLYRCHAIGNCTPACPKGLDPKGAIAAIKELIEKQYSEDWEKLRATEVRKEADAAASSQK